MEKIDLTKLYKDYYRAGTKPEIVQVEKALYISIEGKGDPSADGFASNVQALYAVAYAIKFIWKEKGRDFVVAKLEGLWWYDENKFGRPPIEDAPKSIPRSEWEYRLLIRMPDFVVEKDIDTAKSSVVDKKGLDLAGKVMMYEMTEEKCVQMLHVGPFDKEPETLKILAAFIQKNNFLKNGLHHEIYLSDFRKTAPAKLKTILREPVR